MRSHFEGTSSAAERIRLEYLFQDKPVEGDIRLSDYAALDYIVHGCHIYGQILWPDGSFSLPRPCVILLHGFPGCARNDDIAHALCRAGCVVLTPHHRGAWGSEGEYLISNCIEDAAALAEYVRSPEFAEAHHIDPASVYFIGHSMGGNTALNAARRLPWLRGVVLLTPYDPTRHIRENNTEELMLLSDAGTPLHWGGKDAVYQDILAHMDELNFETSFDRLKDQNILCITGTADKIAPGTDMFGPLWTLLQGYKTAAVHRWLEYQADHGLLGCRCGAIREIGQFIHDTLA